MLTDQERIYLDNLICNDLINWEDFWDLTREDIKKLKEYTFQKNICDVIWYEQYAQNLRKILKYQYNTDIDDEILLKTVYNIVCAYAKCKSSKYWIDTCILSYLLFCQHYNCSEVENDKDFFDLKNKDRPINKEYQRVSFPISIYSPLVEEDDDEKDYISIMREIFEKIGYESWENFIKLFKWKKYLNFSILYLLNEKWFKLTTEYKQILYYPGNLSYKYHPIYNIQNSDELEQKLHFIQNEYSKVSKTTIEFNEFIFKSYYFQIFSKRCSDKNLLIKYLTEFKTKYKKLWALVKNPNYSHEHEFINLPNDEIERMKNQYMFLDLLKSRLQVEYLIETLPIWDLRKLFTYLHHVHKSSRFQYGAEYADHDSLYYQRYVIFELSRLFLYRTIKKDNFQWLNSMYEYSTINARVAIIYNLVRWKFSFSFLRIWTEYFLQWYDLLLKQLFVNFWLWTVWEHLDSFKKLWKESLNDISRYWWEDSEDDIIKDIFTDESVCHEFKASLSLDWRTKLKTWETKRLPILTIIKPVVALLNWNIRWKIVVWIREWEKVQEEVEKEKNFEYSALKKLDIKSSPKSNYHYLTWIDYEVKELLNNKSDDNLIQWIDVEISKYIEPIPSIWWWTVMISVKKFLWKKILIIDVIPGNTVFTMKIDHGKWKSIENIIYIRKNWSDQQLKDPLEIIEFTKNKINTNSDLSNLDLTKDWNDVEKL